MGFKVKSLVPVFTLVSVVLAVILAVFLLNESENGVPPRQIMYVRFAGDIYLRILSCLVLPLTVSAIISNIGNIDKTFTSSLTGLTLVCCIGTNILASVEGVLIAEVLRPNESSSAIHQSFIQLSDKVLDLFRNLLSPNIIEAALVQLRTTVIQPNDTHNVPEEDWKIEAIKVERFNILGIVWFCTLTAVSLRKMEGKDLLDFFKVLNNAINIIVDWVVWISPVGVFSLVAARLLVENDVPAALTLMSWFALAVVLALTLHTMIILPSIFYICTRRSPFQFMVKSKEAIKQAFITASSENSLILSQNSLGDVINNRILSSSLPLTNLINKDGTAIFKSVALAFVAQTHLVEVTIAHGLIISLSVCASCLATPGKPGTSIIFLTALLGVLDLPITDIGLLVATDWILDRLRTCVNVVSNCLLTGVINERMKRFYDVRNERLDTCEDTELTVMNPLCREN